MEDPAVSEIIVVDDGVDDPQAAIEPDPGSIVRRIRTGGRGPGFARQRGLEEAAAPIVLMLDDDVAPSALLASGHAARHTVSGLVVLGYMPVPEPASDSSEHAPTTLYRREYAARIAAYEKDSSMVLRHLWAGNMSMRRDDALRVGFVSSAFRGRRHEDRDLGLHCLAHGMSGVFSRELAATHLYERSIPAFLDDAFSQGYERALLHLAHRDLLGPLDPATFYGDLPTAAAWLVRFCRRPQAERITSAILALALMASRPSGSRIPRLALLKLARRIRQQAGARAAAAGGEQR